jgi:hypothetical protein
MIAMSAKGGVSTSSIAVRSLVGSFAALAIAWTVFATPVFWRQSPVENIARHIIAEDSFKLESLTSLKATNSDFKALQNGRASVLSSVAIINVRLLEQAIASGSRASLDSLMLETSGLIRQSLVNTPADPFLWTVLFWLENTRNGFNSRHLTFLEMSYSVGPNEGWVAVKRNRFALAMYTALSPVLADSVVNEFSRLVESNYFSAAATILEGPGWPIREVLMSGLKNADEISRETFAKIIYRRGIDLAVPGVERPDWRPWH